MTRLFFLLAVLSASPAPTHRLYKSKQGVLSHNDQNLCIADATVDRVIDIAAEELSKSCQNWTPEKVKSALLGAHLYWRSNSWTEASDSCDDVEGHGTNEAGKSTCLVDGLQTNKSMWVKFNGIWTDTLPHEMAHLMQVQIDGESDSHHLGYVDGGCIDIALKASVKRFDEEMYDIEKYGCDLSSIPRQTDHSSLAPSEEPVKVSR